MPKTNKKKPGSPPAAGSVIDVVATITAGANPPGDLILGMQIDSKRLTMVGLVGKAKINPGMHTTSWGLLSPTVRPLTFGVTIVAGDGRVLLNRPNEQTGSDGFGVGADLFTA